MQLNVPFSEIPEHGIEYEIRDTSWFPEDLVEISSPVSVHVRLTKKNENSIEIKGVLKVSVALVCDRCLTQYKFHVDSPMQLVVEVVESDEHWRLQNMDVSEAELETISLDKPVVELAELFRQQLFLALPDKRLCKERCSGLCPQCGADLNKGNCDCKESSANSPFAVLESLKKK